MAGGFVSGVGFTALGGGNVKESLIGGLKGAAIGGATGAIFGGVVGGAKAFLDGKNVWSGETIAEGRGAFSFKNTPIINKPAPVEALPTSVGRVDVPNNPVPDRLARVIPGDVDPTMLGPANQENVFVTAADDVRGLSSSQLAAKLGIDMSPSGFKIYEFNTPNVGISSPINYADPRFVGLGRTIGGAREFWIPNQPIPKGATIYKIIP